MSEHLLVGLATILVLGIGAQWLAWRVSLPAILLLLIFGFIAGPATGFIDPNEIFGNLLLPLVSVSVAIILFEGGLIMSRFYVPKKSGHRSYQKPGYNRSSSFLDTDLGNFLSDIRSGPSDLRASWSCSGSYRTYCYYPTFKAYKAVRQGRIDYEMGRDNNRSDWSCPCGTGV